MTKLSVIYELYLTIRWIISVYTSWIRQQLEIIFRRQQHKEYIDVQLVAQSIQEREKGHQIKILRNKRNSPSNSIRRYKQNDPYFVNLGIGNQILSIDTSSKTVKCEPCVTMEQLIDELAPYHLLPAVVPEFKSLTVGGVLAGAGLESSSLHYGQFSDLLIEATYILSNGQIISCTPTKHSDLFYGALGSCGTFGLLVHATLTLIDAKSNCFVRCNYFRTNQPIEYLSSPCEKDYIDAIVFSDYSVIITGERINKENLPNSARIQTFSKSWDPWFYQHVKKIHDENNSAMITEYIPLKDYLFRYDRGAFWMGDYLLKPFEDKIQYFPLFIRNLFNLFPFGGYNILSRTFLSLLCRTSSLYKRLHASSISIIQDTLLIQDIYIPQTKANQFLSFIQSKQLFTENNNVLDPIWLCPIRATNTLQKFSPHFLNDTTKNDDSSFINFGLWSHQNNWQPGSSYAKNTTKILERKAMNLGGRKMLYSLSYYSKKEWSQIYDIQWYRQMKQKWDPDYAWGDLYHKIIQNEDEDAE